jgi:phage tail sheath protein FI
MAANFLHGVETTELNSGPVPVQVVKSAVIGLVGIAPKGPKNILTLVTGQASAAQFGDPLTGFNIPQALKQIFAQGAGVVLVANVYDEAVHSTQVTNESQTITNGKLKLAYVPVNTVTVNDSAGEASTLVKDVDYSLDVYGNFVALSANAANNTVLKFTYKKLNASAVTSSHIIGSYNSGSGNRSGLQCFDTAKNDFGFAPKILIAPNYSSVNAVAAELIVKADKYRAITLLDAPYGTTVAAAITGRGIGGTINFNTASDRAYLLYPYLKAYDFATNSNQDFPYSSFMAGVIAANDLENSYSASPSNREIKGVVGAERSISGGTNDSTSDANLLNEKGITTINNISGIRTWGNRSAAFPTITAPNNFISVRRTADVIHESLEDASVQFTDQPITPALIDVIRETGNSFIRTLIGRGDLIVGSRVEFPADLNTPVEIAAGHLTYDLIIMPPVPAERITFRSFIDINLLKNLIPQ